ncbi:MAG TPA: M48 family metalloprotease [Acidobacteriaceae bacterium]|nr:M48 family metalloprotease [Acidobacteriaceae bacterium]
MMVLLPPHAAILTAVPNLVYSLPPGVLERARSLYHWRTALDFGSSVWSVLVLLAFLNFRWVAGLGAWATSITSRPWLQGFCFAPVILLLLSVCHLPLAMLAHHISLSYGQSIQGWGSWFIDWNKALLLDLISGTVVLSVLFALIRKSPRWWLWLWVLSLPVQVLVVFVLPLVVDPMFNHFEPLAQTNPALVQQLERVVGRTGVSIPPARMFLMKASEKYTSSNAYVTGFGSSRRVVVWDTTLKSSPPDEILLVFGHELGHYVLHHIERGLAIGAVLSLFFLWIGSHLVDFLIHRYGPRWHIGSLEDWAATGVLMLVLSILSFVAEPIGNSISRAQEHQADVFGIEVVHGIVADPQKVNAQSFQRLGQESLEYPYPSCFVVFWTYTHPPIAEREAFAASYDPWQPGGHPRYFSK